MSGPVGVLARARVRRSKDARGARRTSGSREDAGDPESGDVVANLATGPGIAHIPDATNAPPAERGAPPFITGPRVLAGLLLAVAVAAVVGLLTAAGDEASPGPPVPTTIQARAVTVTAGWQALAPGSLVVLDTNNNAAARLVAVEPRSDTTARSLELGVGGEAAASADASRFFTYSAANTAHDSSPSAGTLRAVEAGDASVVWETDLGPFVGVRRLPVAWHRIDVTADGSVVFVEWASTDGSAVAVSAARGEVLGTVRLPECSPRIDVAAGARRAFAWCPQGTIAELELSGAQAAVRGALIDAREIDADVGDVSRSFRTARGLPVPLEDGADIPDREGYTPPGWIAGVTPSPDGSELYVTRIDGEVRVIDTRTGHKIRASRVDVGPDGVVSTSAPPTLAPDGETLVVSVIAQLANSPEDPVRLSVLDATALEERALIDLGEAVHDVRMSTDGATVFATNALGGRLLVIDVARATIREALLGVGTTPALVVHSP